METEVNGVKLEAIQGDIASQADMEAVVNAANAELQTGGGVAGALHRAAGPELAKVGAAYAPVSPGEAVITEAFQLPNDYVIHCLGPVYGQDKPEDRLLAECYRNALQRAEEKRVESIAFPSISTGAFGYPVDEAIRVALPAVVNTLGTLRTVKHVRFVLFSEADLKKYEQFLSTEIKNNL